MQTLKRSTVYFDPEIHRALRLKAAATDRSVSDLVNEAVELALGEDAGDLEVAAERQNEPLLSFDEVVKDLKRRGRYEIRLPPVKRGAREIYPIRSASVLRQN